MSTHVCVCGAYRLWSAVKPQIHKKTFRDRCALATLHGERLVIGDSTRQRKMYNKQHPRSVETVSKAISVLTGD